MTIDRETERDLVSIATAIILFIILVFLVIDKIIPTTVKMRQNTEAVRDKKEKHHFPCPRCGGIILLEEE